MGFDPSAFPPIADAGSLQREAAKFKSKADRVEELAADSFAAWSGMAGVYEAPEAPIVYGAFAPVRTSGQDLAADARTLNSAVETYAAEAESIKSRYETLISRWHAIEAQKASDDEWREDEDLVQEDNDILSDANSLMAEYMAAQRACANKVSAIYSGSSYVPTAQEGAGAGEVQFGFTGGQLNAAAAEGKLPWGEPTEWDAPWYRDTWDVVASFGKGAWSGVTGTVTGLWNMVNVTDWDTFSTTWKGIGTLAMDVAVVSSPGLLMSDSQRVMESQQRLIAVGKAAVHWDEWQEDPAYAAGATTFDLAAILATAGVGAATKAGSTASKIAGVSGAASKTGTAVRVTGLGAAARTTVKVADLATDLKIRSLDLSTTVARESLGRVAPVATRMHDAVGALRGPVPAYAGAGSAGSRPFSDAVEAGMTLMDSRSHDGGGTGAHAVGAAGTDSGLADGRNPGAAAPATDATSGAGGDSNANDAADSTDETNSNSERFGQNGRETPDSGLSASERESIVAMDKGTRPDPSTYLSPEFISLHLAPFEEGASRFMTQSNLDKYGIAQRDGTSFVMPKSEVDALIESTGGNPRAMEDALGLPEGFFDNGAVRVDIDSPDEHGLRVPSGNEAGANEQWSPGGQLPTGFSEAVVDGAEIDPSEYNISTFE